MENQQSIGWEGGGRDGVAVRKGRGWDAELCERGGCYVMLCEGGGWVMVVVRKGREWDAELCGYREGGRWIGCGVV